ncbi:GNAT family N-acetyltransferase [Fusibacter ferrireducens]|uniref:GNAT family N-acetyltransferase n=1 Tax=Fusibacter ferrireducens TaxID=2785058 RepID=A0ABR9ZUV1_9FIRM|nr:GNAT family N-acetyltransferase [Fusibacter ferrireducens]MBF4693751.1 GNAT family N-acetyltransferase [Fusibacter ferrireducens]
MSSQITIRKVEKKDSKHIISLMKKLSVQTQYMLREFDEINENALEQEKRFESMMGDPKLLYLVAADKAAVVGLLIASSSKLARISHVGDLIVGVDKNYWGTGVGSKLMTELLKWAESTELKRLSLEVVEENIRAIKLYEKYGFKIEGKKIADHFIGNNTYLNTLVMGKILDHKIVKVK